MSTNTTAAAPHRDKDMDRHAEDRPHLESEGQGRWQDQRRLHDSDLSDRLPGAPPSSPEGSDAAASEDDGDRDQNSELHQNDLSDDKDEDEDKAQNARDQDHTELHHDPDSGMSSAGSEDEAPPPPAPAGPKRAKKGKADRSKWKRNNRPKAPVADIGPCNCVNQCSKKDSFRSAGRLKLKAAFVAMDRKAQQTHIAGFIDVVRRKSHAKAMSVRRR
jgi:hypothetical protein